MSSRGALDTLKLAALAVTLFQDVATATFPVSFLPLALLERGHSQLQVSLLSSSFSIAALVGYLLILAFQLCAPPDSAALACEHYRRRCVYLAFSALGVTCSTLLVFLFPTYWMLLACMCMQGVSSAIVWTYSLSLAGTLPHVCSMDGMAFVIAGSTVGEVAGPFMGTSWFKLFPTIAQAYLPMAGMAFLNFLLTAAVIVADRKQSPARLPDPSSPLAGQRPADVDVDALASAAMRPDATVDIDHSQSRAVAPLEPPQARPSSFSFEPASGGFAGCLLRCAPIVRLLSDPTFMKLSLLLHISSIPRSLLEVVLPIYLDEVFEAEVFHVGLIFGCASFFYVFGSLLAGRYATASEQPMQLVLVLMCAMSLTSPAILYAPSLLLVCVAFCCSALILVFANVIACNRLQLLGADDRWGDSQVSDRIMAVSCFFWTGGYAVGSLLSGIPEGEHQQRIVLLAVAGVVVCFSFYLVPTYGLWRSTRCRGRDALAKARAAGLSEKAPLMAASATSSSPVPVSPSSPTKPATAA